MDIVEWYSVGVFAENDYGESQYKLLSKHEVGDVITALEYLKEHKARTPAYHKELDDLIYKFKFMNDFGSCEAKFVGD